MRRAGCTFHLWAVLVVKHPDVPDKEPGEERWGKERRDDGVIEKHSHQIPLELGPLHDDVVARDNQDNM